MKVTLNKDAEIVKAIKEGLEHTGDTVRAGGNALRKTNACARNSKRR